MNIKHKKSIIIFLIIFPLYILLYAANSVFGGYWPIPVAGGRVVSNVGWNLHTALMWQPYYGYVDSYNISTMGYIFYPLIYCDRLWFHRTLDLIDDQKLISDTNPNRIKWHPIGIRIRDRNNELEAVRIVKMIEDPEYCLDEAKKGRLRDRHLIALLLFDKFGVDAVEILALKASKTKNTTEKESYNLINDEIFLIEKKYYRELQTQDEILGATNRNSKRLP